MLNGVYVYNSETEMKLLSVIQTVKDYNSDFQVFRSEAEEKYRIDFTKEDEIIMKDIFALNYLSADELLVWYTFKYRVYKVRRKSLTELFYDNFRNSKYYNRFDKLVNPYLTADYININKGMEEKLFLSNFMFTVKYNSQVLDRDPSDSFIILTMESILKDQIVNNANYINSLVDNPFKNSTTCRGFIKLNKKTTSSNYSEYCRLSEILDSLEEEIETYGEA